ncbi:MAG TPA: hypothetical protein VGB00_17475, partial [Pyrinomonadaceae bacterium]
KNMSYGLTFYTGSYKNLREEIQNPSADFFKKLQDNWENLYDPDEGESLETALREGLAELQKAAAANTETKLGVKGEMALVGAIQSHGRELGTLEHSGSGGEEFREEFLGGVASEIFDFPKLAEFLTGRPFFGVRTLEYPSWGWLLHDEILKFENNSPQTANEYKKDFDEWLADLLGFIKKAKENGNDLMTVYR